jgi:hypothetical protein
MNKKMKITLVLAIPACLAPLLVRTALLYRRLRFGYPFRKIPLTKGKYAIVDPQDYETLSQYNWHASVAPNTCYAARSQTCKLTGRTTKIPMHRSIIPIPDDMLCDHINHVGLDNRSANLRPATAAQNAWNRKKQSKPTSSKYKGVHKTASNTWSAKITVLGKRIHLGTFKTETAAARAYDSAAKTHFGPFAYTNFKPVRFPILNHILIPIKALSQLLYLFCCMFITPLRKFQPAAAIIRSRNIHNLPAINRSPDIQTLPAINRSPDIRTSNKINPPGLYNRRMNESDTKLLVPKNIGVLNYPVIKQSLCQT